MTNGSTNSGETPPSLPPAPPSHFLTLSLTHFPSFSGQLAHSQVLARAIGLVADGQVIGEEAILVPSVQQHAQHSLVGATIAVCDKDVYITTGRLATPVRPTRYYLQPNVNTVSQRTDLHQGGIREYIVKWVTPQNMKVATIVIIW